jgi:hypothetical protein
MESAARILHRITLATAGLALIAALAGHGGPEVALIDRVIPAAPAGGPLTISSPAFADGAPIPVLYTCKGTDTSPPLTWSAPLGGALVVDDLDAPGGTFIHWVVIGIAPGSGSIVDGRTPPGGVSRCTAGPARRPAAECTITGSPCTSFLTITSFRAGWLACKRRRLLPVRQMRRLS